MYTLINKNTPLVDFHWVRDVLGWKEEIDTVYHQPWFITDFGQWLRYRSVTKHREHMNKLLTILGLRDTKAIATKKQIEHVKVLKGFHFDSSGNYNLPSERISKLEMVIQGQVESLIGV